MSWGAGRQICIGAALGVYGYLVYHNVAKRFSMPISISGRSMTPVLEDGDYVVCRKLPSYKYELGDIVLFRNPENPESTVIKRMVGEEGDLIPARRLKGTYMSWWKPECKSLLERVAALPESSLAHYQPREECNCVAGCTRFAVAVPDGHMWVEGDNAPLSRDSRNYGPIPKGLITGRAAAIVWPPSRWQTISSHTYWSGKQ